MDSSASDTGLIAEIRQGNTDRFEVLVAQYQPRVFAIARRYCRREPDVEDLVQEVFIKAWQNLPGFRGEAPFEHWLMRLTVRACYDFLRKKQRQRECSVTDLGEDENHWLDRLAANPVQNDEAGGEARELVARLLARLSPASRLVITMLEIEERSVKEIASLTGWSVPLVKVRAFRARREMRKWLEQMLAERKL